MTTDKLELPTTDHDDDGSSRYPAKPTTLASYLLVHVLELAFGQQAPHNSHGCTQRACIVPPSPYYSLRVEGLSRGGCSLLAPGALSIGASKPIIKSYPKPLRYCRPGSQNLNNSVPSHKTCGHAAAFKQIPHGNCWAFMAASRVKRLGVY